jgi:hypothetical protein
MTFSKLISNKPNNRQWCIKLDFKKFYIIADIHIHGKGLWYVGVDINILPLFVSIDLLKVHSHISIGKVKADVGAE